MITVIQFVYCIIKKILSIATNFILCNKVKFRDQVINETYQCDPTDNESFCIYEYNLTEYNLDAVETGSFSRPCKCGLDGDTGYCSSILGTPELKEGAAAIKNLFSQNQCHTGDRGDYRAMKESCCLAKDKEWDEAAEWNFKINNWPYVQRGESG